MANASEPKTTSTKVKEIDPAADQSNRVEEAISQMAKTPTKGSGATTVSEKAKEILEKVAQDYQNRQVNLCWNCANNGVESKLEDGVCTKCGFDKTPIYNIQLEPGRKV